jgi:transposase
MKMSESSTLTAGIDTGKDKLDVAIHGQTTRLSVSNDESGWVKLATELARLGVGRVGIEATGGYERGVTRHLRAAGLIVVVLQPVQVKAFAKMRLQRAKNDTIDAAMIAATTHLIDTSGQITPDPRLESLADQLTVLDQMDEDIARIKTRLEHIHDKRLRRFAAADMKRLQTRRASELKRIINSLREDAELANRFDLVLSIPGIGERTAVALIVRMPELGQISREQAAALAGLAPFDHDSGRKQGERHIAGGRGRLRRSLYAAAMPASFRWNPALIALYKRLIQGGKCHKSALVACARKLLIYANTVLQRGTPWIKDPKAAA